MIYLFPIMLILVGLLNLFIVRKRRDKLNIFSKTEHNNKEESFFTQFSQKRIDRRRKKGFLASFLEPILLRIASIYRTLFSNLTRNEQLKNIGFIFIGMIVCFFVNINYLKLPIIIILPFSVIAVVVVLYMIERAKLKKEFNQNFPEALNLLVGVVSSGNSISQGITECGTKINGVVGRVFLEMSRRLSIGEDSDKVLLDSYRHLPFREYYFFILAIIVNIQGGGEIKEVIYRLSKMISSTRILERSRDSKTAEIRMTVKILSVLPFAFIFLLKFISAENYYFLFDDEQGNYVLYYVLASVGVGQLIIRSMLSKII